MGVSLHSPHWLGTHYVDMASTQRSARLCPLSAGIKGIQNHSIEFLVAPERAWARLPLSTFLLAIWFSKCSPEWPIKLCWQHSRISLASAPKYSAFFLNTSPTDLRIKPSVCHGNGPILSTNAPCYYSLHRCVKYGTEVNKGLLSSLYCFRMIARWQSRLAIKTVSDPISFLPFVYSMPPWWSSDFWICQVFFSEIT